MFVMMPPFPVLRARLDRAFASRDLAAVRAAAREFSRGLDLIDALQVVVLMKELDDPAFERAAVRWVGRFARECHGVGLGGVQAALEAIDALPAPDAQAALRSMLKRYGSGSRA